MCFEFWKFILSLLKHILCSFNCIIGFSRAHSPIKPNWTIESFHILYLIKRKRANLALYLKVSQWQRSEYFTLLCPHKCTAHPFSDLIWLHSFFKDSTASNMSTFKPLLTSKIHLRAIKRRRPDDNLLPPLMERQASCLCIGNGFT